MASNKPSLYALSSSVVPFANRPNVTQINILPAPRFFNSFATSRIVCPVEIISSIMIMSFPETSFPRNCVETTGCSPSISFE